MRDKLLSLLTIRGKLFRLLVSLAALIYVIFAIHWESFGVLFSALNWLPIFCAAIVYLLVTIVRTYRWFLLLSQRESVSFLLVLRATALAMFGTIFLPMTVGEDVIRILVVARETKRSAETTASALIERITGLASYCAVAAVGALLLETSFPEQLSFNPFHAFQSPTWFLLLFATSIAIFLVLKVGNKYRATVLTFLKEVQECFVYYLRCPRILFLCTLLSLTFPIGSVIANKLIAEALGINISLNILTLVIPVIILLEHIPISVGSGLGGLGIRAVLYIFLLGAFGLTKEQAVAIAVSTRALHIAVKTLAALPFLIFARKQAKDANKNLSVT